MQRVTVPLELINLNNDGFHLLVEVFVFNQVFNLVLDTGASKTVFDKLTIEKYTLEEDLLMSDQQSTGLGTNSMQSFGIKLKHLSFGKLTINDFDAAVLDLSIISAAYKNLNLPLIIGVLGGDILQRYKAVINYDKQTLQFKNS